MVSLRDFFITGVSKKNLDCKTKNLQIMGDYYEEKLKRSTGSYKACFWSVILSALLLSILFLTSCSTKSMVETDLQYRHISELTSSVDSLIHATATWQQSIFERQTALVDSFKQSEVRDTSRTVFLNENGDTTKETIIIKEIIEREHTSSESTQEYYQELFRQTDSLFKSNEILQAKVDSLFHDHNKATVVEKKEPWYKQLWNRVELILLIIVVLWLVTERLRRKTDVR